jgi:AcrR family transcriptional regulator
LFYAHGINNVGVDLVVSRSRATKTSLYRHFSSKDKLVAAFLERINDEWSSWLKARVAVASDDPCERLLAVFDALGEWFRTPTFRGCPFINSAADVADPSSPTAKAAWRFKKGFRVYLLELARETNASDPVLLSDQLLLLSDGAIVRAAMTGDAGSAALAKQAALALIR